MQSLTLSIAVLAAFLCLGAGLYGLLCRRIAPRKAWLLMAVGAVILGNAWLWATMPRVDGHIPKAEHMTR